MVAAVAELGDSLYNKELFNPPVALIAPGIQ
jgi:hypothetical protein